MSGRSAHRVKQAEQACRGVARSRRQYVTVGRRYPALHGWRAARWRLAARLKRAEETDQRVGLRRSPWWALARRFVMLGLLLALLVVASCASRAPVSGPGLEGVLTVSAPATLDAGKPATVVAERSDAPDGLAALLVARGSYGPLLYHATFQGGRAEFRLPAEDTRASGLVTLMVSAGAAQGRGLLAIRAGPPVEPVTPLVGPRTLIADGEHWGTMVAIPFDSYGNPAAEGMAVNFQVLRPDGRLATVRTITRHLVAWKRFTTSTAAGRTTIVANAGDAHGPEASLVETPGWPAVFGLSASPLGLPADGRQLVTLRTAPIVDHFGNQMLDGTLVTFVAETPNGRPRFIPAYTIDGVAEAQIQAPTEPGVVTVRATLYGVASAPLRITFLAGPAVGSFPVRAMIDRQEGTLTLDAGPLLGELGQLAPEGTLVRFALNGPNGVTQAVEGYSEDGRARVVLRLSDLTSGLYLVDVSAGAGKGLARVTVP